MNKDYWVYNCECGETNHFIPSLNVRPTECVNCWNPLPKLPN